MSETRPASTRRRNGASPRPKISLAIKRFVDSEKDGIHCVSCKPPRMELVAAEPLIFLGVLRLRYRCGSCAATAETILHAR
jgi:hypothetical protein